MTRRAALVALFIAIVGIAFGYASAFMKGGAPFWGAWFLAIGIPLALGAVMILGAVRGDGDWKSEVSFCVRHSRSGDRVCAALALPATEGPLSGSGWDYRQSSNRDLRRGLCRSSYCRLPTR
jgi:hypothetical protein